MRYLTIISSLVCCLSLVEAKDMFFIPPQQEALSEADLPEDTENDYPPKPPHYTPYAEPSFSYKRPLSTPKVPVINGVVLLGSFSDVQKHGVEDVQGLKIDQDVLQLPGESEELTERLEPIFLNKPFTQEMLLSLKRETILFYRNNKRPMVTVVVPEQDITSGVVQLVVVEGKLGKVHARGNKYFKSSRLESYVRLKENEPIDTDILTDDITWMNRNPFRRTDIVFTPGEQEGETDIELWTNDRRPIRLFAGVDNTGLKQTGEERYFVGFTHGNLFNSDQIFTYQYTTSAHFHRFQGHTVHYTANLPWRHIFEVYGGYTSSVAHFDAINMKSTGWAVQGSFRYNIPLLPIYQHFLHQLSFGADFKRLKNSLEFTGAPNDTENPNTGSLANLTQAMGNYQFLYETSNQKTTFEADVFWSPGPWLGDMSEKDYQNLRAFSTPKYVYGKLALGHLRKLPRNFSLSLLLREQISNRNLLPSEEFGIGGYNTVRGYDERILNGDNAFVANIEIRTPPHRLFKFKNLNDSFQFLLFCDYGFKRAHRALKGDLDARNHATGVGPGIRYNIDPYLSVRVDWGVKLHKVPGDQSFGHLHFGVIASY